MLPGVIFLLSCIPEVPVSLRCQSSQKWVTHPSE